MKINKTELIAATILWTFIMSRLYMNKNNEKRMQQQIEESIEIDTLP